MRKPNGVNWADKHRWIAGLYVKDDGVIAAEHCTPNQKHAARLTQTFLLRMRHIVRFGLPKR